MPTGAAAFSRVALRAARRVAFAATLLAAIAGCSGHQTTSDGATASPAPADAASPDAASPDAASPDAASPDAAETSAAVVTASAAAVPDASPSPVEPNATNTADPATIDVYITPYYNSNGPTVAVGQFSAGLASNDDSDFLATIAKMKTQWQQLSFPELYVGAIRLYDLGYRNDAVYWFYTAQYRGRQFEAFLDPAKVGSMGDPGFELRAAADSFFELVGPSINGYAFGDPDRLVKVVREVQSEGREIPDLAAIYPNVTFIDKSQWEGANATLAGGMDELVTDLTQQKDSIKNERVQNGTEARYSQLTSKDLPSP
jgi:hypothetical protein